MEKTLNKDLLLVAATVVVIVLGLSLVSVSGSEQSYRDQTEKLSQMLNVKSLKVVALQRQLKANNEQLDNVKKDLDSAKTGLDEAAKKLEDLTPSEPAAVEPAVEVVVDPVAAPAAGY